MDDTTVAQFACAIEAKNEILVNTTQTHLVNYKKAIVFDAVLTNYDTMKTTFVVVIDFVECIVDQSTVDVPTYEDVVYNMDTQQDLLILTFQPFTSSQADICGFKWEYTIKPDATFQKLADESESEYIHFNNDAAPEIWINATESAVEQTTIVTVTGQLTT